MLSETALRVEDKIWAIVRERFSFNLRHIAVAVFPQRRSLIRLLTN